LENIKKLCLKIVVVPFLPAVFLPAFDLAAFDLGFELSSSSIKK